MGPVLVFTEKMIGTPEFCGKMAAITERGGQIDIGECVLRKLDPELPPCSSCSYRLGIIIGSKLFAQTPHEKDARARQQLLKQASANNQPTTEWPICKRLQDPERSCGLAAKWAEADMGSSETAEEMRNCTVTWCHYHKNCGIGHYGEITTLADTEQQMKIDGYL